MITEAKYKELRAKLDRFEVWRNGRTSYKPEEVPANIARPSNAEISQVEVYEFVNTPPVRYFAYIKRNVAAPGICDNKVTVTTWTGQILGYGYLGKCYFTGKRPSKRYTVQFTGINKVKYRGTYYASAGDYARFKKIS